MAAKPGVCIGTKEGLRGYATISQRFLRAEDRLIRIREGFRLNADMGLSLHPGGLRQGAPRGAASGCTQGLLLSSRCPGSLPE